MFNTIKSKILLIVIGTMIGLIAALSVFSVVYFKNSKQLFINAYYLSISDSMTRINRDIAKIEDNARDMAIFGEIFYKMSNEKIFLDKFVTKIISDYRESISGGVFYEPYVINKNNKYFSSFAYLTKKDTVVLNNAYDTEANNYLKSNWYKNLMKQIIEGKQVAWSKPYYESNGVNTYMVTAGVGIYDNKNNLIGLATADWGIENIIKEISTLKPTKNSFLLFADRKNDFILASTDPHIDDYSLFGKSLSNIPWYLGKYKDSFSDNNNVLTFKYHDVTYASYVEKMDNGMILIVNIPENELYSRIFFRFVGLFSILIPFIIILCIFLYSALKKHIITPINLLTEMANKIGKGETNVTIKIDKPVEFSILAETFDRMLKNIKKITKQQLKMDSELSIARSIQLASMPNIFPAYPDREEFDIYATMTAAKEVGGDFYDFYFIDSERFMFLIADVSGKGVPAALFMMTVKTLISNMTQSNNTPKEIIEAINRKICENNKEGFFVTMFACIVNINTGEVSCINCGHNPPLIKSAESNYEYLTVPTNIALGVFPNAEYNIYNTTLYPGDKIFLYTDGVTEAISPKKELFGEKRLQFILNNYKLPSSATLKDLKNYIDEFTEYQYQSDDITMLMFEYKGFSNKKVFKDVATKENYKKFYPMLYTAAKAWNLDEALANKIYMCAEELYANVTFHAYPILPDIIEIELTKEKDTVNLTFKDEGIPYNPLEKEDPDINLPPEKRPLGGLGIFMVKQMADDIIYERTDDKNIITLKFNIVN